MSDTTVPPPPAPAPATPSAQPVQVTVDLESLPPDLQKLEKLIQLQAKITEQKPDGTTHLQTIRGEIVIKTDTPLPVGKSVTVTLAAVKAALTEVILTLPRPTATTTTATQQPAPPATQQPVPLPPLTPGVTVQALPVQQPIQQQHQPTAATPPQTTQPTTLTAQPQAALPLQNTLPAVPQNLVLKSTPALQNFFELTPALKIVLPAPTTQLDNLGRVIQAQITATDTKAKLNTPATRQQPAKSITPPTLGALKNILIALQGDTSVQPVKTTAITSTSPTPRPTLQPLQAQVLQILPQVTGANAPAAQTPTASPQAGPPTTQQPLAPPPVMGTVTGTTLQNQPVVLIPDKGVFILQTTTPTPLPAGTQIQLQFLPQTAGQQTVQTQTPGMPAPYVVMTPDGEITLPVIDPLSGQTWPVLDEALEILTQLQPQTAQALRSSLPTPTAQQLPSTTLFFLAALKSGTLESWIGPKTLETLQQAGRQTLIDALRSDFSRLATQSSETTAGDWRVLSLPMSQDDRISQIQIFVRQYLENEDSENSDTNTQDAARKQTRFVLNFSLSQLGPMQLDGLLRQKTLDLIVRTDDALDTDVRQNIRQKFTLGLEHANLNGEMSFQTQKKGWIDVSEAQPGAGVLA